jgi:exodeoxyribonuclease VII small subunit
MTDMKQDKKIDYAALQSELDELLSGMQGEDTDVDQAIKDYARGLEIIQQLEAYLKTAENTVRELKASFSD